MVQRAMPAVARRERIPAPTFGPWSCSAQPPGAITHPDQLPAAGGDWLPADVPGTVAAALHANGQWDYDRPPDLDGHDWWYRTTFTAPALPADHLCHLCCDGLATLAEVWLNGERVLTTDNMFRAYRVDVASLLQPCNELVIGFRSLAAALQRKRPRPRWKTNLVNHQQLRWFRTSLLGRIPGWSPPAPPVGPWRPLRFEVGPFAVLELRQASRVDADDGEVTVQAWIESSVPLRGAVLEAGGVQAPAAMREEDGVWRVQAVLRIPDPPLWWPHTHGAQPLSDCVLHLHTDGESWTVLCGKVGFRRLSVPGENTFSLHVNDVPVYCRGACWTVHDPLTLTASRDALTRTLRLARDAGVNMLRVPGTMVYESDAFYDLCDELGIMVWQDFPFANMDYPTSDPDFAANVAAEATYQLTRLSRHPCVAVLCGNSEVEQQAAMLGMPCELWRNDWFAARLPALCAEHNPDVPYVPSTPSGGVLPFHVREGVAHYYGVGAYLRSPAELRKADVKFAPECLAFANIPEAETVDEILAGGKPALHHPRWKQRVPRDTGAGWDFDDVRDFYLEHLFGVDAVKLRCFDPQRYLQLSRVVPGEIMSQVFAEWRSGHSSSRGALVLFFKDLWPAAGWGIVDSRGIPKAAYYYLRRCWRERQITVTDEGLDGLHLHVTNETAHPLAGRVELLLLRDGHVTVARGEQPCRLPPRSRQTFVSAEIFGGFFDVTYAYRFGPPTHEVAIATLFDEQGRVLSEAFYFVAAREPLLTAADVSAHAVATGAGCHEVTLHSSRFLQAVALDAKGFLPEDNYFHLTPNRPKCVRFTPTDDPDSPFRPSMEALNLKGPLTIRPEKPAV